MMLRKKRRLGRFVNRIRFPRDQEITVHQPGLCESCQRFELVEAVMDQSGEWSAPLCDRCGWYAGAEMEVRLEWRETGKVVVMLSADLNTMPFPHLDEGKA